MHVPRLQLGQVTPVVESLRCRSSSFSSAAPSASSFCIKKLARLVHEQTHKLKKAIEAIVHLSSEVNANDSIRGSLFPRGYECIDFMFTYVSQLIAQARFRNRNSARISESRFRIRNFQHLLKKGDPLFSIAELYVPERGAGVVHAYTCVKRLKTRARAKISYRGINKIYCEVIIPPALHLL